MASLLVRSGTNNAETKEVALVVSVVVVAAVYLAAVGAVVIAATTAPAVAAIARANIPAPLPNIATHVVESVAVCLFLCH